MFGLAAVHKFAAWNKPDLLAVLLPHLTQEELNMPGGRGDSDSERDNIS
jgi:hypothetical protein